MRALPTAYDQVYVPPRWILAMRFESVNCAAHPGNCASHATSIQTETAILFQSRRLFCGWESGMSFT